MSERVVILGATSGIGAALAAVLSQRGCRLLLAGRSREKLDRLAADLKVRHEAEPIVETFDATDFDAHAAFIERCVERFGGGIEGAVLCHGLLPDQQAAQRDHAAAKRAIDVNFTSAITLLEPLAAHLERQGRGWLAAIGSVAGDRGRQSNYLYGSAKAGLDAYLSGLRNRLHHAGVAVLTVKPGFVATAMTEGRVNPDSPAVASPEKVARDIDRAIRRRRHVLYTPWFWRPVMCLIRHIPELIFKRMKM